MEVSFFKLIYSLLPFHKRLPKRLLFLKVLANKLDSVMNGIRQFRINSEKFARTTYQKILMEKRLNDLFDNTLRRITINEYEGVGNTIGYESETNFILASYESEAFDGTLFGYINENTQSGVIINVPAEINMDMVMNEVNKYRFSGSSVIIIEI